MNEIVIDANFLVALLDGDDSFHTKATEIEMMIPIETPRLYFDVVVSESLSVLARRSEERKRIFSFREKVRMLQIKLPYSNISWVSVLIQTYYSEILELMTHHNGKLNFNDALIVVYMKKNNLQFIASFDSDFDDVAWVQRISTPSDIEKYVK
jgi:predicted nucleic acid-binding protein